MQQLTQAQEQALATVTGFLRQSFGDLAKPSEDSPSFFVDLGKRGIWVQVMPMGDDDAAVHFYQWVGQGLARTPELLERLLTLNNEYRFGALALEQDGDIIFEHATPAIGITKANLALVARLMASVIDDIDTELQMRFG